MDDIEQFSRALSAMAKAGAYSAKDIRQICTQEVQYEEIDSIIEKIKEFDRIVREVKLGETA